MARAFRGKFVKFCRWDLTKKDLRVGGGLGSFVGSHKSGRVHPGAAPFHHGKARADGGLEVLGIDLHRLA